MPTPVEVAIFGGKGGADLAAQTVLNLDRATGSHKLAGYLNDRAPVGSAFYGGKILGRFDDWPSLTPDIRFVAPVHGAGRIRQNSERIRALGIPESRWTVLIDPSASVGDDVSFGPGSVAAPLTVAYPHAVLGSHCFLRPGAVITNEVVLGDFVYVGANAVICGGCHIGTGAHIAPGALVKEDLKIGAFALVGLGAVVTRDVPAGGVVYGNPARPGGSSDVT